MRAEGGSDRGHETRRRVTVLFADLVGSTTIGERLDPEALREVQQRYFGAMRVAIERHEGTVEKFIGDAVMAVYGIPQLHEDDALRAVRSAFDMQRALATLNNDVETRWGVRLAIHTGINTGVVVAGDASTNQSLATGDVVNTAERLEAAAQTGEVLIGAETYRLVRHAVTAEPVAPLELKGKPKPVPAWRVSAVDPTAGAIPRRLDSPMVGRDRQLRILRDAAERSRDERSPQLVTVLGLAGVGKSRLVHEFLAQVRAEATVIQGRCLSYGDAISYWPLAEALRDTAGIEPDDTAATVLERLGALAEGLPQAQLVTGRVAAAIGLTPVDGTAPVGAQETYSAFRRLFEVMARRRPLVAVFDDVHWGTATFLDLVEHIIDWSRDAPILLLTMARPELLEARPSWGGGKLNATALLLEPLDDASVAQLLGNLVGHQLPEDLTRTIEEAAEGNPLFVEELVAKLVDDGALEPDDDGYRVTHTPAEISVPPTIELLLASRLDHLPSEERAVLQTAAVVGMQFGTFEVAELSPESDRPQVLPRLMALVRKELLRLDEEAPADLDALDEDVRFRFRHHLVRDGAYEGLAKHERSRLHEAFADSMERALSSRLEEHREVIGYHLEQAAAYRKAVVGIDESVTRLASRAAEHLEGSARRADAIGDGVAVRRLLTRANALRPADDPRRLANLPMLAAALWTAGRLDEARVVLEEVLASPHAEPSSRAAALELTSLGEALGKSAAELRPQVEEALRIRRHLGDPAGIARALLALAVVDSFVGRLRHAWELAEEALGQARQAQDIGLQARLLEFRTRAFLFSQESEARRGVRMLKENLTFAREYGLRARECLALIDMGIVRGQLGARAEGKELIERGHAMQRDLGWELRALGSWDEATLDYWAGDIGLAADRWRIAYDKLAAVGEKAYLSTVATQLAQSLIDLGESREAEEVLRTAEGAGAPDDVMTQVQLKATRARLLARRGGLAEAEGMAREAVREAEAAEYNMLMPYAHLALGDVLRLAGRLDEAAAEWRSVIAFEKARGNKLYVGRLRRELGELEQAASPAATN
jgi:class 3 adenylate cyclase/tetratricopeptide (TPR) repeat protein